MASANTNLRSLAWNCSGGFPFFTLGILLYKSEPFSASTANNFIYPPECCDGSTAVSSGFNNSTSSLTYWPALSHLFQSSSLVLAPNITLSPVFKGPLSPIKSYAAVTGEAWSSEASIRTLDRPAASVCHILRESSEVTSVPSGKYRPCLVGLEMITTTSSAPAAYFRTISRCPLWGGLNAPGTTATVLG